MIGSAGFWSEVGLVGYRVQRVAGVVEWPACHCLIC